MEAGDEIAQRVFPAYAGMSRRGTSTCASTQSFPRLRGDEPAGAGLLWQGIQFSPPTRG